MDSFVLAALQASRAPRTIDTFFGSISAESDCQSLLRLLPFDSHRGRVSYQAVMLHGSVYPLLHSAALSLACD